MNEKLELAWKTRELQDKFIQYDIQNWINNELFSWNWWILVAALIIPWIIWIKFYERKRLIEILLFGALIVIPTTYLDAAGSDLGFWMYPTELIPITPRAIAFDMSMVAIAYMLIYQYFMSWKSFSKALVIMALFYAFIGEPLSHLFGLVYYIRWKYYYSFIYYIAVGFTVKWIVEKAKKMYTLEK